MNRTLKHTNVQQDDNSSGATFGKDICYSLNSSVALFILGSASFT